jgi:hypothetical protein
MQIRTALVTAVVLSSTISCIDPDDPNAVADAADATGDGSAADRPTSYITGTPTVKGVVAETAIANSLVTRLPVTGEEWDAGGMHSLTLNTSRFIAPIDGIYQVSGTIEWRASTGGIQRYVSIRRNGSTEVSVSQVSPVKSTVQFTSQVISGQVKLTAGQYIEAFVLQDSGASLNIVGGTSHIDVSWIALGS